MKNIIEFELNEYVKVITRHGYKIVGKVINQSSKYVEIEEFGGCNVILKKNVIVLCRKGTKEQILNNTKSKPFSIDYVKELKKK